MLTNSGTYPAELDIVLVAPAGPFALAQVAPTSVPPGASRGVHVSFGPTQRGATAATLVIRARSQTDISSVDFEQPIDVPLAGGGSAPVLELLDGPAGTPLTVLDFGATAASTNAYASFWIGNGGDRPMHVAGVVDYNQSQFGIIDAMIFPATLAPGNTLEVPYAFLAPPVAGNGATGTVHVLSDDPRPAPVGDLTMRGRASGAHLAGPPELIQLATEPPLPLSVDLVFRSDGTGPVAVDTVKLTQGRQFTVTATDPATLPTSLAPGTELRVTVALTGTTPGVYRDRLVVRHDGNPGGTTTIQLVGTVT